MSAAWALLRWSLRRDRGVLVALAAFLLGLQVLIVWIARTLETENYFTTLGALVPTFVRRSMGFDFTLLLSFGGAVGAGYLHPAVVAALLAAAMVAARSPASEVDLGTADLVIARPVPRWALVARSLGELAVAALLLPAAMVCGTTVGLALAGRLGDVGIGRYLGMAVNDALLLASFGALFVLVSASCTRVRTFTEVAVGLAIGSFLLDFLAQVWAPIRPLGLLSPFHYLEPGRVLASGLAARNVAVLAAVAVAASAAALAVFQRRDL